MKKIVLILWVVLLMGSSVAVQAASNEYVQATAAEFVLKINGEERELSSNPLVVDGVTYLPIRDMAALFGYELGYDDTTRTINFDLKPIKSPTYQQLTASPDMSEWVNVLDLVRFYKANDIKADLSGDNSSTELTIGVYGVGFPFSLEEQYKHADVPKLYSKANGKFTLLVYNSNIYVNKAEIKKLEFPVEDEWLHLNSIKEASAKLDFTPLNDVKKLKPVFLYTEQGIIRAMNSKSGILLNKEDLTARGFLAS